MKLIEELLASLASLLLLFLIFLVATFPGVSPLTSARTRRARIQRPAAGAAPPPCRQGNTILSGS